MQSGEINSRVDDPLAVIERDRGGVRLVRAGPARRPHGRLRATGGSTCARATPNRCCGSTSKRPTRPRATRTRPRCWPAFGASSLRARSAPHARPARLEGGASWRSTRSCSRSSRAPTTRARCSTSPTRTALYNPRLKRRYRVLDGDIPDLLIDDAETVDDAEDARLTKKAEADGVEADVRASDRDRHVSTSSTRSRGCPSSSRPRTRRPAAVPAPIAARTADAIRNIVVLGMGGSGISGDVVAAAFNDELPGAGHGAEADPHARVRRARHARVRDVVLGRHRGDGLDGARARSRRARSSSRCRAAVSSRRSRATRARCTSPCPPGYLPRAAIGALVAPLCVVLFRLGLAPGAHAQSDAARRSSSRVRRDACRPEVEGVANPARELARQIDRTIPLDLRRRRARCGRRVPVEVRRQRERQGARVLEHVPGARPQRDLRVGPARRRHPPAHHAHRAAARLRARAAAAALRRDPRDHRRVRAPGARRSRRRARAGSRSCSTSCTSATGRAATSRCRTTSIPDRSTRSSS